MKIRIEKKMAGKLLDGVLKSNDSKDWYWNLFRFIERNLENVSF